MLHRSSPTLDELRAIGIRDLGFECPRCLTRFEGALSAIDAPVDTCLRDLEAIRPFPCPNCNGSAKVLDPYNRGHDGTE